MKAKQIVHSILMVLCYISGASSTLGQNKPCFNIKLVNDFVENQLANDNTKKSGLLVDSIWLDISDYYDPPKLRAQLDTSFFTEEDIESVVCQDKSVNKYHFWNLLLDDHVKLIPYDTMESEIWENGWDSYKEKYGKGFYMYTVPLFSVDGKKALMVKKYTCGPFCGYTKIMLFKKDGENWSVYWEKIREKK